MPLSEWKETTLGEVIRTNQSTYSERENWSFINYLDTGNITENKIDNIQYLDTNIDKIPSRAKRKVKANDVVYSTVRPNQKHYGIITNPVENMLVSTGFVVIDGITEKIDNNFLYCYLTQEAITEYLQGIAENSTSTYPSIKPSDIETLQINLPPLYEQQAIAEVLGSLDDKIELNRKMNKTLEDMAQAIFKSWFVDFDPVKAKAEGRTIEGLSQEILDLFPDSFEDSELGEIPKGWSIYEFDDILEITSSKRIFMSDYVSEGIPFYRSKEIIEKQKGNNVSTELFITKQKYNEIKDKFSVPKVGDILLTSVGTLGVSYLVKNSDEFYFKDGNLTWFKNYTKTFPEIIYYWLRSSMGQSRLEEISIGSTQKALTIASMKKINIILPSVEIQKELNMTFKIIRDNIDFHNDQIETLSTMRDTLLPKLISGELRIPDAEKLMEGVV